MVGVRKLRAKPADGEMFPGERKLDTDLMDKAEAQAKMAASLVDPTLDAPKKAALTAEKQESSAALTARFFATHGMAKRGHMLGDELSAAEEKRATEEAKANAEKMNAFGLDTISLPSSDSDTVRGHDTLVMPEDDDADADYKK